MMEHIPSADIRFMNRLDWDRVLLLEQIPPEYWVGGGVWMKHCEQFNRNRKRRIGEVRHMSLTQQCRYYREKAFIRAGQ